MHIGQKVFGIDIVQPHESGQGGAVFAVIGFLDTACFWPIHPKVPLHKALHAGIDLGKKIAGGPVKGVVEIEDPDADMAKIGLHGADHGGSGTAGQVGR